MSGPRLARLSAVPLARFLEEAAEGGGRWLERNLGGRRRSRQ